MIVKKEVNSSERFLSSNMPYPVTSSSLVVSSDYNVIRDRISDIMGSSSVGYGRVWSRVLAASTGSRIESIRNLLVDIGDISLHQSGQVLGNLGLPGQVISADFHNYLNTLTNSLDINRYVVDPSQLEPLVVEQSGSGGFFSGESIRTSIWSGVEITHQVKVSWYNGQQAQSWFNLGGRVEIKPRYQTPVGSDPDDIGWASFIDSINTQTYVRSDYMGSQTKFYPLLQNGTGTFAVTATRALGGDSILFDLSYNFSGSGGSVAGLSLIVIPSVYTFDLNSSAGTPFTVPNAIDGQGTYSDYSNGANNIFVSFDSNGSYLVQGTSGGQLFVGNWGNPTTDNAGSNYWIRFTLSSLSGVNDYQATQTTGWLPLSSPRSITVLTTVLSGQGNSSAVGNYFVQIASDSSGSVVVSSGSFILASIARQNLIGIDSSLPQSGSTYSHSGSGDVRLVFSFLNDGTVEVLGSIITASASEYDVKTTFNWFTPNTVGVGSNYWIKVVKLTNSGSGSGSSGSTDIGSYQLLSTSRSVVVNAVATNAGDQTHSTQYQVSISTSASDSSIVSSGVYTLNVTSIAIVDYIPDVPAGTGDGGSGVGGGE